MDICLRQLKSKAYLNLYLNLAILLSLIICYEAMDAFVATWAAGSAQRMIMVISVVFLAQAIFKNRAEAFIQITFTICLIVPVK